MSSLLAVRRKRRRKEFKNHNNMQMTSSTSDTQDMNMELSPNGPNIPDFEDFCYRTTWHGVSDLYKSRGKLRLFWVLAILVAMGATGYGCYAIVAQYMKSPVVISYMIHPAEAGRPLPDIVVCPFNRFNRSILLQHNISDALTEYVQTAFSLNTPYKFPQKETVGNKTVLTMEFNAVLERLGNLSFMDFIDFASFSCDSLVEYCITPQGMRDCCKDAEPVVTPVGKCYRLTGPEQISSGFGFGMTILIKVPADRYLSVGKNNLHNDGVSIKLAEKDKGLDFDLTFVPAGVHALMPLRATKYDFINDPPRYECLDKVANSYSSIRCFDDCFFTPGMNACKCSHVTSANRNYSACKPNQLFDCLITETLAVIHNSRDYVKNCHSTCKPACSFWQFHPTVSYARFPTSTFYNYVGSSEESLEHWGKSIVLDVFYEKLEYTWIKHYPSMTIDTFVSNIGGQVGLWIGGSILSLAQLLIFLVHYCWGKFTYKAAQRVPEKVVRSVRKVSKSPNPANPDVLSPNGDACAGVYSAEPLEIHHCLRQHSTEYDRDMPAIEI